MRHMETRALKPHRALRGVNLLCDYGAQQYTCDGADVQDHAPGRSESCARPRYVRLEYLPIQTQHERYQTPYPQS